MIERVHQKDEYNDTSIAGKQAKLFEFADCTCQARQPRQRSLAEDLEFGWLDAGDPIYFLASPRRMEASRVDV